SLEIRSIAWPSSSRNRLAARSLRAWYHSIAASASARAAGWIDTGLGVTASGELQAACVHPATERDRLPRGRSRRAGGGFRGAKPLRHSRRPPCRGSPEGNRQEPRVPPQAS